jgi:hypothetical protein
MATLNMTDANLISQSISVDQLAAMPDEQRAALLQAQDTAALAPMILALVKAKDDTSRVVLGDVMFIMQERLGDPVPYFEWCASLGLNN